MSKTTEYTVARAIESLLQDHIYHNDEELPHIMGQTDGSEADIDQIDRQNAQVKVVLSDGTKFNINVTRVMA